MYVLWLTNTLLLFGPETICQITWQIDNILKASINNRDSYFCNLVSFTLFYSKTKF